MPFTARQLVDQSLEQWTRAAADDQQKLYERLQDHYEVDMQGQVYFPRYYQESDERYQKRPKFALPLASATIDVLAGAMIGEGVQVTVGDSNSPENKAYQEIQQHNDLDGENALAIAQLAGIYGWGLERPILEEGGMLEFERVTPIYFRPFYNNGAIGRTVKRLNGVSFTTYYDRDSGVALPRNTALGSPSKALRVEVITPDEWMVFLDGELQPTDPNDQSVRWMPRDDGANPYRMIPASMLWNVTQPLRFEGRSDVVPGYKLAEQLSQTYSQMLYNLQMVFPTLTIPKSGGGGQSGGLKLGIGLGLEYDLDGQPPAWISPNFDVSTFMEPLKAGLTLFFSMVHTPASAHGLGTIFNEQTGESGKAKFYELGAMVKHVDRKRTNFKRFIENRWKVMCAFLNAPKPYGRGMSLDPMAPIEVEFASPVVPMSDQEITDDILSRLKGKLISHIEAILESRGWEDTDDNREKAQKVIDEIGASTPAPDNLDSILTRDLGA